MKRLSQKISEIGSAAKGLLAESGPSMDYRIREGLSNIAAVAGCYQQIQEKIEGGAALHLQDPNLPHRHD